MLTEIAKGKTIAEAKPSPTRTWPKPWRAAQEQAALLQPGRGCASDGHQELRGRRGRYYPSGGRHKETHRAQRRGKCYCPYCDVEIQEDITFCEACQSDLEEEH
jgi:nitrogen fixation NifU-like protein